MPFEEVSFYTRWPNYEHTVGTRPTSRLLWRTLRTKNLVPTQRTPQKKIEINCSIQAGRHFAQ